MTGNNAVMELVLGLRRNPAGGKGGVWDRRDRRIKIQEPRTKNARTKQNPKTKITVVFWILIS